MAAGAKRGRGRPRLSTKGKGEAPLITIRVTSELLSRLDKWRKAEKSQPTRSQALRQLADAGLAAAGY